MTSCSSHLNRKPLLEHVARYRLPDALDEFVVAHDLVSRNLFSLAMRVAQTDTTVLLSGRKAAWARKVVARYIHNHSARRSGPFVAINCAAIHGTVCSRRRFSATRRAPLPVAQQAQAGKFEQAQNGTLLLDEVTEMPLGAAGEAPARAPGNARSSVSGARSPSRSTSASSPPPIGTWPRPWPRGCCAKTSNYRLNVFPLADHRLASARRGYCPPGAALFWLSTAAVPGGRDCVWPPSAEQALRRHSWRGQRARTGKRHAARRDFCRR